jgi:DNA-binding FadR family transcriptional regulator
VNTAHRTGGALGVSRRVGREHEDIYDAIARRDPDAARAAMWTHLANSRERGGHAKGAGSPLG